MTAPVQRVAVIGAGLVGSSIALAIREAGAGEVTLVDTDPGVRERARALGIGSRVVAEVTAAVHDADLVIAAVPAAAVPGVLLTAAQAAPTAAILTDAASLKATSTLEVTSRLRDAGAGPERFVGGHPMAGSERSGPEAADARLFQGATWVLTPTAATADATLTVLSTFLRRLGARVVALSPEQHDELVAVVSHLPQVVASALAAVAADAIEVTGDAVLAVAAAVSGTRPASPPAIQRCGSRSWPATAWRCWTRWTPTPSACGRFAPAWPGSGGKSWKRSCDGPVLPASGWCRSRCPPTSPTWSCRWTIVRDSSRARPRRSVRPASTSRTSPCGTRAREGGGPCCCVWRQATSSAL
jgi:prephenate dehydrogenase